MYVLPIQKTMFVSNILRKVKCSILIIKSTVYVVSHMLSVIKIFMFIYRILLCLYIENNVFDSVRVSNNYLN